MFVLSNLALAADAKYLGGFSGNVFSAPLTAMLYGIRRFYGIYGKNGQTMPQTYRFVWQICWNGYE